MVYFPLFVDLTGKRALVVGQGRVAKHKSALLAEYGAKVYSVPTLTMDEIGPLLDREVPALAVISLPEKGIEAQFSRECKARRIPVNVVDVPALCTFIFPCLAREEDVVIGVSSSGNSPLVAQRVRDEAKKAMPEDIGAVNELMGRIRPDIIRDFPTQEQRKEAFSLIFDEMLAIARTLRSV